MCNLKAWLRRLKKKKTATKHYERFYQPQLNAGGSMLGMAGVLLVAAANGNRDNAQFEIDLTHTLDAQRYRSISTYPYYIDPLKHITDAELATHLRLAIKQSTAEILTQLPTASEQPPQLTLGE